MGSHLEKSVIEYYYNYFFESSHLKKSSVKSCTKIL